MARSYPMIDTDFFLDHDSPSVIGVNLETIEEAKIVLDAASSASHPAWKEGDLWSDVVITNVNAVLLYPERTILCVPDSATYVDRVRESDRAYQFNGLDDSELLEWANSYSDIDDSKLYARIDIGEDFLLDHVSEIQYFVERYRIRKEA